MSASESLLPLHRHPAPLQEVARRYKAALAHPGYVRSILFSGAIFLLGLVINLYAIAYATKSASNSVTDIILSNIPVFDVDALFVYGTLVLVVFSVLVVLTHPRRVPFALCGMATFWIIRSLFTSLTHFAPFESHFQSSFGPEINKIFFGGDLFFSGHTGMPFLAALAFWREKGIRNLYLFGSLFFAVIVLLGHLHYSIDVLSAFFITYGIFHIAEWLFPEARKLFYADL
jgi:hypothetical protein